MQVFDYLGEKTSSKAALEEYQCVMNDFFTKSNNHKNQSTALLIHQNCKYNENNRNCWMELTEDMNKVFQVDMKSIEEKEILLVSVEDIENGEEN